MPACEGSSGILGVRHGRQNGYVLGQEVSSAAPVEPGRPACEQKERRTLISLPDDVLTTILGLLDWHRRVNMASLCQRLQKLVNGGPWLRSARFGCSDKPIVFTMVMLKLRVEAITELDVSYYGVASSQRLLEGIQLCKNVVILRCVHSCLLPSAVYWLLLHHLRSLECLYWSVVGEPWRGVCPSLDSISACIGKCSRMPATLRLMYVEAFADHRSIAFVQFVLKCCHRLRSLHLHGRETRNKDPEIACRLFSCFRTATRDDFDYFTYTSESAPCEAVLPKCPVVSAADIYKDLGRCVEVYKHVTVRWGSTRTRNCGTLAELELMSDISCHRQLTALIAESGEDSISRLKRTSDDGTFGHVEALTLMPLPEREGMFRHRNMRNQVALCNFIRSCFALTELNLSAFHFSEDFNCCSMLSTGGLNNIRSLSFAPCVLCSPRRLELLSRASFKLRQLDVRTQRATGNDSSRCEICLLETTCDDASLAPLCRLRHLECLTLCGLLQAHTLSFLIGCSSLRDLRLEDMGVWHPHGRQDMSPIAYIWRQLRTLKLEGSVYPIDFSFMNDLPVTPKMTRVCLATNVEGEPPTGFPVLEVLNRICPAADVAHFHQNRMEQGRPSEVYIRAGPFLPANDTRGVYHCPSADKVWLCFCKNYVGATKPYGVK